MNDASKRWLNGEPYYCELCGAGLGEFMACEMPDCKLESKKEAEKRRDKATTNPHETGR